METAALTIDAGLRLGEHLCCLYRSEDEHRQIRVSLIRAGLERGCQVVYAPRSNSIPEMLNALNQIGLNTTDLLQKKQLVIAVQDNLHLQELNTPVPGTGVVSDLTRQAQAAGFPGLWYVIDVARAGSFPEHVRPEEAESRIDAFAARNACLIACLYDQSASPPALLLNVLQAHPLVLLNGQVHANCHYVPPDEFAARADPAAQLRRLLDNLAQRRQPELQPAGRETQEPDERAMRQNKERYQQSVENSPNPIFSVDRQGKIQSWNPACEQVLTYGSEVIGQEYILLLHESQDRSVLQAAVERVFHKDTVTGIEIHYRGRDGALKWTLSRLYPVLSSYGQVEACVFANTDITERKRAEEKLRASLEEKEVLLKEIHHRVKNNLQIVSSLLNLQSQTIHDARAKEVLQESQNRIRTMALIHERLYRSLDLACIDLVDYVSHLAAQLVRSHTGERGEVVLQVNARAPVLLSLDTAIPCGLIVNELIWNSLKHAFPAGRAGELCVEVGYAPQGQVRLTVADDGVGLPEDFNLQDCHSLGLRLVNMLVQQIDGRLEIERAHGSRFTVEFAEQAARAGAQA